MTIYKVNVKAFHYWYRCDHSDFVDLEYFFLTKEKAEEWIANNKKYIHCGYDKNHTEARNKYEMPIFHIETVEVIE